MSVENHFLTLPLEMTRDILEWSGNCAEHR